MTRTFLVLGCISGMFAVALGAFGAHFLNEHLSDYHLRIYETGNRYHMYHTFALIIVALTRRHLNKRWTQAAAWLFFSGILCFSGSLYLLAVVDLLDLIELKAILGPLTPIGGILFISGWLALARAGITYKSHEHKVSHSNRSV